MTKAEKILRDACTHAREWYGPGGDGAGSWSDADARALCGTARDDWHTLRNDLGREPTAAEWSLYCSAARHASAL